jgi:hypothetical protein
MAKRWSLGMVMIFLFIAALAGKLPSLVPTQRAEDTAVASPSPYLESPEGLAPPAAVDCGTDTSCLIERAETCGPATAMYTLPLDLFGILNDIHPHSPDQRG